MSLHTQLADIAADNTWSPVYRMEAVRALAELPDGPSLPDGSARNLLHGRVAGRRTESASPDDVDRLRARFAPTLDRLGTQDTDPGVWDDLAAENAALAPARTRANRALLGPCCDMHNVHCEPPSELCCNGCTEASHPEHRRGERCVLDIDPTGGNS